MALMESIPPSREDGLFTRFSFMIHSLEWLQSWAQAGAEPSWSVASGLVSTQASVVSQKQIRRLEVGGVGVAPGGVGKVFTVGDVR